MLDLILLGIIVLWLVSATLFDIKTKEVPNWLTFSLIIISFCIFIIKSISEKNIIYIINSLLSFGFFIIIGNIMYYTNQWGGGDSKLLMGLGAALPLYPQVLSFSIKSIYLPLSLLINIILIGTVFGLLSATYFGIKNKKKFLKEFKILNKKKRKINLILFLILILGVLTSIILSDIVLRKLLIFISILPIFFNYLLISTKAIELSSMYKKIKTKDLVEGDWVTEKVIVNKKIIYSPKKTGITKEQIKRLQKYKKEIIVKQGIVFVPVILIATIITLIYGNLILYLI
jgi:Flp pilus assembly protein protease CpaA